MKISVITPCYNEEENVADICTRVRAALESLDCEWEHWWIDNASTDGTVPALKAAALEDPRIKVIVNNRNFGHIRSPFHGIMQTPGDAVISMAADGQDPPELIPRFVELWREGNEVVLGQKVQSEESPLFYFLRSAYYRVVNRLAEVDLIEHVTGFGLYDRRVIEAFRATGDPYPYVRGLISELGFSVARVPYKQPQRKRGISKNNFYTLYDIAMLGVTSHSKVPLRLATMMGFAMSAFSFLAGLGYLIYKLLYWQSFSVGIAPLVIGLFFIGSVQLMFLGIVGEYIGAMHTQILRRPHVIERERVNSEPPPIAELASPVIERMVDGDEKSADPAGQGHGSAARTNATVISTVGCPQSSRSERLG